MQMVARISFVVLTLTIAIYAQGVGGGKGAYDGRSETYGDRSGSNIDRHNIYNHDRDSSYNHNDGHHRDREYYNRDKSNRCRNGNCGGHSTSGLFAIVIIILLIAICCCCGVGIFAFYKLRSKGSKTRNPSSNVKFDNVPTQEPAIEPVSIFPSGVWLGRYFQYDRWHEPYQMVLSFDPKSSTVNGQGSDDVGSFTIDGRYSANTNEIELKKTYQPGTGDPIENSGHNVTIEVTWNPDERIFKGNWYVNTDTFRDEDVFELKFEKQLEPFMDAKQSYP